jgi:uncharacterized protein YdcH (DUF465 family)
MGGALDVKEPQNEREFMLLMNANIERLTESVDRLSATIVNVEEKRVEPLEEEIEELKRWRSETVGAAKMWGFIYGGLTLLLIAIQIFQFVSRIKS